MKTSPGSPGSLGLALGASFAVLLLASGPTLAEGGPAIEAECRTIKEQMFQAFSSVNRREAEKLEAQRFEYFFADCRVMPPAMRRCMAKAKGVTELKACSRLAPHPRPPRPPVVITNWSVVREDALSAVHVLEALSSVDPAGKAYLLGAACGDIAGCIGSQACADILSKVKPQEWPQALLACPSFKEFAGGADPATRITPWVARLWETFLARVRPLLDADRLKRLEAMVARHVADPERTTLPAGHPRHR